MRPPVRWAALAALVSMLAAPGCGSSSGSDDEPSAATSGQVAERLPDLDQEAPSDIVVQRVPAGGRIAEWLGFDSAVANVGDGPIIVRGRRSGGSTPSMAVDQIVRGAGGASRVVPDIGTMRYVTSPDHSHWHLLGFERYELRRASDGSLAARDRKSGFCLGDRYPLEPLPAGAPPEKVYTGRCGLAAPRLREVVQGISVGYGDDYDAILEGQYVDISHVPPGRYALVHRVDVERRLVERSVANNAASLAISLTRRDGRARVQVLRSCPARDRCTVG